MELMIGERRIDVPQEEVDRLVEKFGKIQPQPKYGDEYWLVYPAGNVEESTWLDDSSDLKRLNMGNMFFTEEDAETHRNWLEAVAEIKRSSDFVPDWDSNGQSKYFVYYDHNEQQLCVEYFDYYQNQSIVHYETRGEAERAIKDHKDAYLTYFGIRNAKGGNSE